MRFKTERLPESHRWWRIADPAWADPLDPTYAEIKGGRWNPARSYPTLYLNEDQVTSRLNLRAFVAAWPYEPEDLRDDTGPILVGAKLPREQQVCDAHTRLGVAKTGLHDNYPFDLNGHLVPHQPCQGIGKQAKAAGLRGVWARSAQTRDGAGREVAWFPASSRSRARSITTLTFEQWFWG